MYTTAHTDVFFNGRKVRGADPNTLQELGGGYAKDRRRVYFSGVKLSGAPSLTSFEYQGNGIATDFQDTWAYGMLDQERAGENLENALRQRDKREQAIESLILQLAKAKRTRNRLWLAVPLSMILAYSIVHFTVPGGYKNSAAKISKKFSTYGLPECHCEDDGSYSLGHPNECGDGAALANPDSSNKGANICRLADSKDRTDCIARLDDVEKHCGGEDENCDRWVCEDSSASFRYY